MRFALSEDQAALRDAVRELLAAECPPAVVRAGWPGDEAAPERVAAVWAKLAEMGVLGAAVPEAAGGLGLGACDVVPLLEEAGRVALPLPLAETAFVAAPLLAAGGDPEGLLEGLIGGETLVAAGLDGSGLVAFAGVADRLLVADGPGEPIRLLPADAAEPVDSIDGARRLGRVAGLGASALPGHGVSASPALGGGSASSLGGGSASSLGGGSASSLGGGSASVAAAGIPLDLDPAAAAAAWDRGVLGAAAQLVGLGRTLLAMSTEYVQERRQFGVPIGTFQAVKHQLANALLALEFAAPAVLRAAWSLDQRVETASRDVAMAKALASDAAERVAAAALQVHGAIAYTTEYDLHLFAKRAWAASRTWGDPEWQRARVADALKLRTERSAVPYLSLGQIRNSGREGSEG